MTGLLDVAGILGVASLATEVDLVERIGHGLPIKSLDRISGYLAPDDATFKYHIVPKASLARRKASKKLSPSEGELVARLAGIWASAFGIWRDEEDVRAFLGRRHPLLDNKRPLDLAIESEAGARLVENILGRLESGVAV